MRIHILPQEVEVTLDPFVIDLVMLLSQMFLCAFKALVEVILSFGFFSEDMLRVSLLARE